MKDKRTIWLMGILLALIGIFLIFNFPKDPETIVQQPVKEELLAGNNEIKSIEIRKGENGALEANVRYFYRGGESNPVLRVITDSPEPNAHFYFDEEQNAPIKKGEHSATIEIKRQPIPQKEFTSHKVIASLGSKFGPTKVKKEIEYSIEWPDSFSYNRNREFTKKTTTELYKEAVEFIDQADSRTFNQAKKNLERILLKDPAYIDAYPELARFSMKSNWGPEGLKQAETYLLSGLALQKDHANSHVLLGYVYTHQNRFDEAEQEFITAEKLGTNNLWLWANWGELNALRGKHEEAISTYLKAIASPRTYNTYDRARLDAYRKLFALLNTQEELSKADELYKRRAEEYPNSPCFLTEYAAFRISRFEDFQGALNAGRKAIDAGCDSTESRQIMGVANYLAWASTEGQQRDAYLSQAQIFFPESPQLIYLLSRNDSTSKVLSELKKQFISIDTKDNENYNALAYALMENDISSARRLIKLGAQPAEPVSEQEYPVALIPVFHQHTEGVQLLLENGVNLATMKYRGISALGYAEQLENPEIYQLIKSKSRT